MFFLLLLCVAAVTTIWGGVILQILWAWFMVPTFGFTPLGLAAAIGLSIVIGFLTHQYVPTDDEDLDKSILYGFIYPLVVLAFGFVVRLFM